MHQLTRGRRLILGGVEIPFELGLAGHSDADVPVHALMDALLGALGAGDIGQHFPDSDPQFKGINSLLLLERVVSLVEARGYRVVNADIVVIAQRPKLAPYMPEIRRNLADVLKVEPSQVGVKATTTEHLGFTGRGEGIAAQAVALLARREDWRLRNG